MADIIEGALYRLRNEFELPEGQLTAKPADAAIRGFNDAIITSGDAVLSKSIRKACGYRIDSSGNINHIGTGKGESIKHELIEPTLTNMLLNTCNGFPREDGTPLLYHQLLVAAIASNMLAVEKENDRAPIIETVAGLGHDCFKEDIHKVPFRMQRADGSMIEISKKEQMPSFIINFYGDYFGREILKIINLVSREAGEGYMYPYLYKIYKSPRAELLKFADTLGNGLTVETIADPAKRTEKRNKVIPKQIPQLLMLKKDMVIPFELLLSVFGKLIEGVEKYSNFDKYLRAPAPGDISAFRDGYRIIKEPRSDFYGIVDQLPSAGMPSLVIFTGGKRLEMCVRFCSPEQAFQIAKAGFGKDADVQIGRKIIPFRADPEWVVSIGGRDGRSVEKCARRAAGAYTEMLAGGEILSIFKGMDRQRRAAEASRMWRRMLSSQHHLNKFKLQKMQVR